MLIHIIPNYYTHLTSDQRALAGLPAGLSELIEQRREALGLGCLGLDPLSFCQPIHPNTVRRERTEVYRHSALPAVERLRQAIEDGVPTSTGYGAGFLRHLVLDSTCHGYVDDRAANGPISHMVIEGEYDRILVEWDGLNTIEQPPLPSAPASRAVWEAASQVFAHASPDRMRRVYRFMALPSGFLTRSNGRITGRVTGAVSHMLPILSAKGIALKETPHPSAQESNADLSRLLEATIPETAEQITAFFRAISVETPVPRRFDRDFEGNPPPIPQRIRWQDIPEYSVT